MAQHQIQVHGHRGARGWLPENTLPSIRQALQMGAHGVEVDVSLSADGVVMVHHDLTLNPATTRDAQGNWITQRVPLLDIKAADLRQYDVSALNPSSEYAQRFIHQQNSAAYIPTLQEFIDEMLNAEHAALLNIELKSPATTQANSLLEPQNYIAALLPLLAAIPTQRLFVQSFDWRLVLELQRHRPDIQLGLLCDCQEDGDPRIPMAGAPSVWTAGLDRQDYESIAHMISECGVAVMSINALDVDEQLIQQAHELGLLVYVWTVNEVADIKRCIELGVDVITSDYPDRVLAQLSAL